MNQKLEKENNSATITELVAKTEKEGEPFFKPVNEAATAAGLHSGDNQPPGSEREQVLIQKRLRKANMLVKGTALGPEFADEYRRIKRPLLSNAFGKTSGIIEKGNLILVTSSIPGEGKTHTAINLALSFAHERDHTVLLVDCDVTQHGASRALGIVDRPGLVDVLEDDDVTVGDVILRTDIPELCLISAGKQHDYVTELLASQRMSRLVTEIGERYEDRIIVFDGPPLLPTPQTQVLTGLVGQVVFVVEAGKTPQILVDEAVSMIPENQATGLVMNKSEGVSSRGSYYYGRYGDKST